jgi:hypothetical protein
MQWNACARYFEDVNHFSVAAFKWQRHSRRTHMKTLSAAVFLLTLSLSTQSFAASYSTGQCQAWFNAVDRNKDGTLGRSEKASMFLSRITLANDGDREYIMTKGFFVAECKIGSLGKPQI